MSRMVQIAANHWNLRDSLTFAAGLVDIGTHMSFIRLDNGKFLLLDTCKVNPTDKAIIDDLTQNGDLIEAVVATHPFHTLYFEPFHKMYPNAPMYGTARHLRRIPSVPWVGDISQHLKDWESHGIHMRIPAGADFIPADESNHFSGIFVYHEGSKSVFNDDTVLHFDHPGFVLCCLGKRHGGVEFWDMKKGLRKEEEAPAEFKQFILDIINDWDFDKLVLAHTGNINVGAKDALRKLVERSEKDFDKLAAKYRG